jgi:DNA topoisomerase-2
MLSGEPVKKKTVKDSETKIRKVKKEETSPLKNYVNNGNDIDVNFELIFEDGYLETERALEKKFKLVSNIKLTNMHAYSPDGVIKKYKSVETILYDYYLVRLQLYSDRKDYLLDQLAKQLELLSWKVKFILMVVEDKIIIRKQKKSVLEEKLNELGFPILSSGSSKTENYDYLLGMELWNLTYEKVEELKKKHREKQSEYDALKNKTPEDMWLEELQQLEMAYNKWVSAKEILKKEQIELTKKKNGKSVKKTTKKTN